MTVNTRETTRTVKSLIGAVVIGLPLAACGTSPAATGLTTATGNHVSSLATELQKLEKSSKRVAEARAGNLVLLSEGEARLNALTTTKLGAIYIANPEKRALYERIFESLDALAESRNEVRNSAADRIAMRLAKRSALKVPAEELNGVAKDLAALASEPSVKEQVSFLKDFFEPSISLLRAAIKQGNKTLESDQSEKSIAALLDEVP